MMPDEIDPLEVVWTSEATTPPWVGNDTMPEAVESLRAHIFELIDEARDQLSPLAENQAFAVAMLLAKAATWGWDAAIHNGPMSTAHATQAASQAKRSQRSDRYAAIRAAFESMAASGEEPDIARLADTFAVSKPTVYRALREPS